MILIKPKTLLLLATALLSSSAQATLAANNNPLPFVKHIFSPFVATLSLGPAWASPGQTQTFYLTPSIEKTYSSKKSPSALFDGELFFGRQLQLHNDIQGQIGLAIAATSNANARGYVWDDANPLFNNFTYHYRIQHTHIAIKGKALLNKGYPVTPWLSASLGIGLNRAHGFESTPTIVEALPIPPFASHTSTAFTYTLGAGIQRLLTQHVQVGMGYEFADWGQSQLHRAEEQTMNSGLRLNHLYTNALLLNITYTA